MIIVCTSKSGASYHSRGKSGGSISRFEYGQMADSGSYYTDVDTIHKLLDDVFFTFVKIGAHWRAATVFEMDLYKMGHRNLNVLIKF